MGKPIVVGIDLGGTNLRAASVTSEGEILKMVKKDTPSAPDELEECLIDSVRQVCQKGTGAAVLASAGLIDPEGVSVLTSPNLKAVTGRPLGRILAQKLDMPVRLVNDASAAALGESWLGAGRPFKDIVMLTLGTGVGGGVVIDGKLLDIPAEIGHISLDPGGPLCQCGMRGCLETYASATAIAERAIREVSGGRESMIRNCCGGNYYRITAELVYENAMEGDYLAREILKEAGQRLGTGVAGLVNIFGPEAVIFGGGMGGAWDFLGREVEEVVGRLAFPDLARRVKLLPARFSDEAGILGAAKLALDMLESNQGPH